MNDLYATPRLGKGVQTSYDRTRDSHVVTFPEGVLVLNETAAAIVEMCDGRTSIAAMVEKLATDFDGVRAEDVVDLLTRLAARRVVVTGG